MIDALAKVSEIFERAKQSPDELLAFLRMMPKSADLHHHLDGSCYYEDILEFAISRDLWFDPAAGRFSPEPSGLSAVLASHLLQDPNGWQAFRNTFSAGAWQPGTGNGKQAFFGVFGALAALDYTEGAMLAKMLQRSAAENIHYEEIIAPVVPNELIDDLVDSLPSDWQSHIDSTISRLAARLSEPTAAAAIAARLDEWEAGIESANQSAAPTAFRYLGFALRNDSPARFLASTAAVFAATQLDHRVVGYSMAGGEDLDSSLQDFELHLEILSALRRFLGPVPVALHTGELTPADCDPITLASRIRRSVVEGHASRIGHGVSIKWEDEPDQTMALLRERNVAVEICLSSNSIILEVSPDEHPIRSYLTASVPAVICTDDDAISRSSLSQEYQKAVTALGLGYCELKSIMRLGLMHSFLSPSEKALMLSRYDRAVANFELEVISGQ